MQTKILLLSMSLLATHIYSVIHENTHKQTRNIQSIEKILNTTCLKIKGKHNIIENLYLNKRIPFLDSIAKQMGLPLSNKTFKKSYHEIIKQFKELSHQEIKNNRIPNKNSLITIYCHFNTLAYPLCTFSLDKRETPSTLSKKIDSFLNQRFFAYQKNISYQILYDNKYGQCYNCNSFNTPNNPYTFQLTNGFLPSIKNQYNKIALLGMTFQNNRLKLVHFQDEYGKPISIQSSNNNECIKITEYVDNKQINYYYDPSKYRGVKKLQNDYYFIVIPDKIETNVI